MLSTKRRIIKKFDERASTYNAAATVQAHVAAQLACKLMQHPADTILEIGCGTEVIEPASY